MALKILQPGVQPLGQFDGLDSDVLTMKGGECVSFAAVTTTADAGAADVGDGYALSTGPKRPAVTRLWGGSSTLTNATRPIMLSDEGVTGYGTLFGVVVGGTVGQTSYGPNSTVAAANVLGPHTAAGSGKVTCWDKPGLYGITLDNTDGYLQPTNVSTLTVGTALSFTSTGLLTVSGSSNMLAGAPVVAHFVEFNTNGSLVTTPNYLVAALNSPSGNVSSVQARAFTMATIYFAPPTS